MPKTVVLVVGPTGIGKTSAAIEIAQHFGTEIVSADSRQMYKEMKIGTAVPDPRQLDTVRHHFIATHSVNEYYNASRFENEAIQLLDQLFRKKDIVVMAGGSMLYIDAVCNGIDIMPDPDPEIRTALKNQFETEGLDGLRLQLKKLDPDYYAQVDLKNPTRVIHALEISIATGKPYSSFRSNPQKKRPFSITKIALDCDRKKLHNRINSRVDKLIEARLEDEAGRFYAQKHLNSLNTVGYREFFACFDGTVSKEKAIELIKRNSRRYARKQLTWFRKDREMNWFEPGQSEDIIAFIENKIKKDE